MQKSPSDLRHSDLPRTESLSTESTLASPFFITRTLKLTLPRKSPKTPHEVILIRFELENTSHHFSREARVEVIRFGEQTRSFLLKRTGFARTDVTLSEQNEFQIADCLLGLEASTGTFTPPESPKYPTQEIAWNLRFAHDAVASASFESFPKGLRFFAGQSGQCKTLFESRPVQGFVRLGELDLDLNGASASLFEDYGKRRLLTQIRFQSLHWLDQNGQDAEFLIDVFSGEARLGTMMTAIRSPRFTTLYLRGAAADLNSKLNSTWNSLRTRSRFHQDRWTIESDSGSLRTVVEIQSPAQAEWNVRVFDTDQTPLLRRINPRATAQVHLYRLGKLVHNYRSESAYLERLENWTD